MRSISLISLSLIFCNDVPSMVVTAFAPPIKASPWKLQRTSSSCSSSSSSKTSSSSSFQTKHLSVAATKLHLLPEATSSILTAAGPDWGIFEGRTLSLLHPVMMFSMLGLSLYTALLGFQWRRQRTIGDDISALKKTLPSITEETFKEALAAAKEAGDSSKVTLYENAISTEQEISSLTAERKELSQKNPRDAHFSRGALLAFIGTVFAIEGPLNTYARAGKLFPGPHLYAGAGLVCLWALVVSTIPSMQKGSDTARTIHISANVLAISLFAWQVQSGIPILLKVIEKTSWP